MNHITSIQYTSESQTIIESDKLLKWSDERGITADRLFGEKDILIEQPSLVCNT